MLHAPTGVNVLRCLAGGALKHVGFSLEHMRANHERMRSTQHGEAVKVGHANVAASNPAAQVLMAADDSLSASAAVTKVGHANAAATNPAAQVLMAADDSLSASAAVTKVGHANSAATNPAAQVLMAADDSLSASAAVTKAAKDEIRRAHEEEWAKRQRQEAALGLAFQASSVAKHLFR
jgi:hypothetical protein